MTPKIPKKSKKKFKAYPNSLTDPDDISSATDPITPEPTEKENILTSQIIQQELQIASLKDQIAQLTVKIRASDLQTEQHASIKAKLFETLNQNTLLRNEIKQAQKCIQREIGAEITLAVLTSAKTSWHGRAEQISVLQNKIAELKTQRDGVVTSETDAKYLQLRQVDSKRKIELETVEKQLTIVKQDAEEQRNKLSAQRVRNYNLQNEIVGYKQQLATLSEKIHADDLHICKLKNQIEMQKDQKEKKMKKLQKKISSEQSHTSDLETLNADLKEGLATQTDLNSTLTDHIDELTEKIKSLEAELRRQCGDFLFNCRELRKTEYMAILDVLQFEKERLLVQLRTMDSRLRHERGRQDGLHEQIRTHKSNYSRLDCKYNECLKEMLALKDRNRRTQRVATYVRSTVSLANSSTSVNSQTSTVQQLYESLDEEQFQSKYEIKNLQNKMDIANERITLQDDRINELNQEKITDYVLFSETIARSKYVLVEHLIERKKHELCRTAITTKLNICEQEHDLSQQCSYTPKTPTKHMDLV